MHTRVFHLLKRTHDMMTRGYFPQPVICMKYANHSSLQQKISCKVRDGHDCLQKVLLSSEAARNIPTTRSTPVT